MTGHRSTSGWIGVDLDGTLAFYDGWKGVDYIGDPVPKMLARVKAWLKEGKEVRIMTARVSGDDHKVAREYIEKWLIIHLGIALDITYEKDFAMVELWDDRCIQVNKNTGERVDGKE